MVWSVDLLVVACLLGQWVGLSGRSVGWLASKSRYFFRYQSGLNKGGENVRWAALCIAASGCRQLAAACKVAPPTCSVECWSDYVPLYMLDASQCAELTA
eukprot:TRINITY_DN18974_c0_g1_i1.p1 TRINITY_DN18974_c0_g1~~TRINITY_DN18974_c0_g1_i1.p1  ORF type:complete len:100 (+),score=5.00 TRINITY_DN18974_c0_g1_i1:157-456(+)